MTKKEKDAELLDDAENMLAMYCAILADAIVPGRPTNLERIRMMCVKVASKCDDIVVLRHAIEEDSEDEEDDGNVQ